MRKLKDDIKDLNMWKKCKSKLTPVYASWCTNGSTYYNQIDGTTSKACHKTPILLRDESENYWTESVKNFCRLYVAPGGISVKDEILDLIHDGEFYLVYPNEELKMWSFKVDIDIYHWDCPHGANKSGMPRGSGDYLVAFGDDKPDLRTIRVVHERTFQTRYREESK